MNARAKELLIAALDLPRDERAELARDLVASLDEEPELDVAWAAVIRERVDAVLAKKELGPECRPYLAALRDRLHRER
ncbi:MAG: addiction module protein [Polyangiaceae bacterium]